MSVLARRLLAALLVAVGLALAAFFWLLFAIADCSADCQAAGERAVPVALVGAGLGVVVAGAVLWKRDAWRAAGWGAIAAGGLAAAGSLLLFATEGVGRLTIWVAFGSLLVTIAGSVLRRVPGRA